jgi:diguanylate cyclase (GGDEF)-like protein
MDRSAPRPSEQAETGAHQRSGWRAWLVRRGRWQVVLAVTLFSMLASVVLAYPLSVLLGADPQRLPAFMLVAFVVPAIVAPLASSVVVTLAFDLEAARAALDRLARRDALTELFNRRYFHECYEVELRRAWRTGSPLAVLMIDADHFKVLNDTHGHQAGDEVLRQMARLCAGALRPYDLLARYGGEEFVVLLPGLQLEAACTVAERIRRAVADMRCITAPGVELRTSVSVGVACLDRSEGDADTEGPALLQRADRAMYRAKAAGRNCWSV